VSVVPQPSPENHGGGTHPHWARTAVTVLLLGLPCCAGTTTPQSTASSAQDDPVLPTGATRPAPRRTVTIRHGGANPLVLFDKPSPFGRVLVVDEGDLRHLRFGGVTGADQSTISPSDPGAAPMECIRHALVGLALVSQVRRALLIGMGGGTFSTLLQRAFPRARVDAVEINPVVVEAAKRHFGVRPGPRLKVHGGVLVINLSVPDATERVLAARIAAAFPGCASLAGARDKNLVLFGPAGGAALPDRPTAQRRARAIKGLSFDLEALARRVRQGCR